MSDKEQQKQQEQDEQQVAEQVAQGTPGPTPAHGDQVHQNPTEGGDVVGNPPGSGAGQQPPGAGRQ